MANVRRAERYSARVLLDDVQEDPRMTTVLAILAQHQVTLSLRANGELRARILGRRGMHPDLARLVWLHAEALLAAVKAHGVDDAAPG